MTTDKPQKPDRDPLLDDILLKLERDPRSTYAKSQVSGLSTATLNNWKHHRVRRPQSVSLQMAYAMLGYELVPVRKDQKR